ncbi:MAG: ketosteroid isomerase-like protein [Planctomycetota bacterium]|jgi:ketosteroid isomerase-like protein
MSKTDIVQRGWNAFAAGDFDTLAADYTEDMLFIMPGQTDVLEGRAAFRSALDGIGDSIPPGFDITGMRHMEGTDEVVTIVEWKSDKMPASQLAILFKFRGDLVCEERWFVDTEQWKGSF